MERQVQKSLIPLSCRRGPWFLLLFNIGLISLCYPVTSLGITSDEKNSLRGLTGVLVQNLDFHSVPTDITHRLPMHEIRVHVLDQLRQARIPVFKETTYGTKSGHPFLSIGGAISQIAGNFYAYTIIVELHQQAMFAPRQGSGWVVTWSVGSLSTGDMEQIHRRIALLVDQFIEDFVEVNPPSSLLKPIELQRPFL